MPRGYISNSHQGYSDEQREALNKCFDLQSEIDKTESIMKVIAIITLVIFTPLILVFGVMYALSKVESWLLFLIGGLFLGVLLVLLVFVIRAQIIKRKRKAEIKRLCREYNISL